MASNDTSKTKENQFSLSLTSESWESPENSISGDMVANKIEAAAHLNKTAITVIRSGGDFHQALHLLGQAMLSLELNQMMPESNTGSFSLPQSTPEECDWNLRGLEALEGGSLYVYNKPIIIRPGDDPTFCKAAILFNSSLIYHALSFQSNNETMLLNALMLYDLSFQGFLSIQVPNNQVNCCLSNSQIFRYQFYALVAWNNQAHLHLLRQNTSHALEMLEGQKPMIADLYQRAHQLERPDMGLIHSLQSLSVNIHQAQAVPTAAPA